MFRTDKHHNPCAITTDLAKQAGLILGKDYEIGDAFPKNFNFYTAKILGDPIAITIKVIDKVGYYTKSGGLRWIYIALPDFLWHSLTYEEKKAVIAFHYKQEGGTEMKGLFL